MAKYLLSFYRTCYRTLLISSFLTVSIQSAHSAHLIAEQSGPLSDTTTFGVLPQSGDTLDAGHFTITIDQSFSAGLITAPEGNTALKGEFVIEPGITLTVNGDWDASQPESQNLLKSAGAIEFDGPRGISRRYIAASKHYRSPSLIVQSTAQNKAFFGLKPGSSATFVYDKQGFLGANISGGHVHLNGFSSGYIHDGYDRPSLRDCNMPNVLFSNSGRFDLRYFAKDNGSCNLENLTILSPTTATAFKTVGGASYTTQGPKYNLNGLSVDGGVEYYTRPEFLMNDWVVRGLAATLPNAGWQNADSWLLFDVDTLPVGSAFTSNIYFRGEKYNPHGFSLAGDGLASVVNRTLDSVIFDFNNSAAAESGDMYLLDGPAQPNETVIIRNNIALKNLNGKQSSTFVTFNNANQNDRQLMLENNVVFIPGGNRAIALNEASLTPSNVLSSIKDNIFWGDAAQPGHVIGSLNDNSLTDILAPKAYTHNGVFNARADGQNGALDLPLSYTPNAPVVVQPPYFYDDQRRLQTYGASELGLDGSAEAAFKAFVTRHLSDSDINRLKLMSGHQRYVTTHKGALAVKDLIDWVKQGFIATTTSYHSNSSTDGILGLTATADFILTDSDGDSVDNRFDQCANTPSDASIDNFGCDEAQYKPQHLIALQSGSLSDINTFGVLARNGDTLDVGNFTVTIDQTFSAGVITAPADSVALKGEFVVQDGITLTVNGDWDASQPDTQTLLKNAAHIEFDGPQGVRRNYLAASRHYGPPSLMVQSDANNKAFFGLKPGSAATFVYNKQDFLGANISGGNVHLNGFRSGYIHDGYDRPATWDCNMPNTLFSNSGLFELRYFAADNGSCDLENLTILSPIGDRAFKTQGSAGDTTQGAAYNLNGLSVDGRVEYYTRSEFLINDWVLRDLAATLPQIGWQNADSWLLFNADSLPVGSAITSNIYFRGEKYNPHGFSLAGDRLKGINNRTLDSVVFDFNNLDAGESGDMYMFDGPAQLNETVLIQNNIALPNLNGNQSSTFVTFNSANQNDRQISLENNVVFIPLGNRAVALNEASLTPSNSLSSVKNNIFWGDAEHKGYVLGSLDKNSLTDILAVDAWSNNSVFNARTDGQYAELDLPLSYTPVSGATTDAPRFFDDQRRLETYGARELGLDGSAESAFNAFVTRHLSYNDIQQLKLMAGHANYVTNHKGVLAVKDLIDWTKQGFIATTSSYHQGADRPGLTTIPAFVLADSDNDLVDDLFDLCANTQAGDIIDDNGCANSQKDDDNDGVSNLLDVCIATVANTTVNEQGCSVAAVSGAIPGFTSWGIGGGGAMAGYSINPFNDKMRFVGTDMGSVFRSLNGGKNWTPVNHSQTTYSYHFGYAVPFGFAGGATVLHAPEGLNPVRSIDGGQTFHAPASFILAKSDDGDSNERVTGWYSDTVTIGTVYATTTHGLWRSVDAGDRWQFVYDGGDIKGMFIDNQDDGKIYLATAKQIVSSTDGETYVNHFTPVNHKIHRFSGGSDVDERTLSYVSDQSSLAIATAVQSGLANGDVAAIYTRPFGAGDEVSAGMVYVSKNDSAFALTSQFAGSHLAMAQNDPQTLYVTGSRSWGRDKGTSVYVSDDGGSSWQLKLLQYNWNVLPFAPWGSQQLEYSPVGLNVGWYDAGYYSVAVNQLNSDQFGGSGNFFVYGSENGGNQWLDLSNNYHGNNDQSNLSSTPLKGDKWSTSGLNVTSVYDIKFNPANNSDIYAAYADIHGARSTDHGVSWQILPNSENSIYDYAFDVSDANTVFMVNGNEHDWPFRSLSKVGNGGVFKSSNKGDSWQRLTPDNADYNRQYLSVGFDTRRNTLYAGSQSDGISRSQDGGASWEKFNQGLPATFPGHDYAMDLVIPQIEVLDNGNVYALVTGARPELSKGEVNQLGIDMKDLIVDTTADNDRYFGWINSAWTGIYLLDVAAGATEWQLLRGNIDLNSHDNWDPTYKPWKRPMSFAVDPNDSNILWLTDMEEKTAQYGASGVWKSLDKGQNWQFMQQHSTALDIDIAPDNSRHIIVVGPKNWRNGGIFVSKDGGKSWLEDLRAPLQNNAHSVCFDPQDSSKVVYGYFGGGMLYGDAF